MRPVGKSQDFHRIAALPRRTEPTIPPEFEALLKVTGGTQKLRPVQAQALFELAQGGGLFGPIQVGAGKTLISLLAAYVLDAKRPILLLPASLLEKTQREMAILSKHWRIPKNIRPMSYEMLSRVQSANTLELYKPDLLICDEVHKLKNKRAGVTKRVRRYMHAHPETAFVGMSGTVMRNSLKDFGHILGWTHKDQSPLPLEEHTLMEWSDALDEKVNPLARLDPGVLLSLPGPDGEDDLSTARRRVHARISETAGVVSSQGDDVACSLYVQSVTCPMNAATEDNFKRLRVLWERPDGWMLSEAVELWRVARELSIGMHYQWSPFAPKPWLEARKAWAAFARDELSSSRTLDTELQVVNAVDRGDLPEGREVLAAWRAIKGTFTVNSTPVWHDDSALVFCEHWLKHPGICWVAHSFFGEELSKRTGIPYFGPQGLDKKGQYIEDATGPIIASAAANATGKNLQRWDRNLITAVPASGSDLEQLIGRTHRHGQLSDQVTVDILMTCYEHRDSFEKALATAKMTQDTLGHEQKILKADVSVDNAKHSGYRWNK
jgi:hypothetical protein